MSQSFLILSSVGFFVLHHLCSICNSDIIWPNIDVYFYIWFCQNDCILYNKEKLIDYLTYGLSQSFPFHYFKYLQQFLILLEYIQLLGKKDPVMYFILLSKKWHYKESCVRTTIVDHFNPELMTSGEPPVSCFIHPVLSIWSRSSWSFPSHAGHRCPVIESSQSVPGGIFFYNSFLCSVIYRIVIRFSRWSCFSPPGSIRDFNRTHLDLWWFTIGQYGNRGVLYAFIISRTEKSTIHINFMISRVDRYMRRTTLQNARTCGGILFPIKSGKRKGLNKFIINHYMTLLCSSSLVVQLICSVKLTFCN